ncbi:hypothetical protein niasHT_001528 [Heterodera trifolii]|uniref:Peroxisome assembly protein 12 n=1 Tax=Heterodera trifolii TaxID=157864 RepID=A0ABD2MB44_9BILA
MFPLNPNFATVLGARTDAGNPCAMTLPSIFEYLAQESLSGSMKQGIRSVLNLFSHFSGRRLSFVDSHFDELFLLLHLFLENRFLKRFSASFSENFYGMKRVPWRMNASSFSRLGYRFRSLFLIVVLPYIHDKFERLSEQIESERDAIRQKGWRRLFLRFYPSLKALLFLVTLLFQLAFVFSFSSVPSLSLLLAKCRLEKLTLSDVAQFDAEGQLPFHLRRTNVFARLWRSLVSLPSTLGRLFTYALFLVQFLEYFYSDELGRRFGQFVEGRRNIRIPTHPFNNLPTEQQTLCMEVDKCPICRRTRKNDTVLTVSGYVFCHSCIFNFVRIEHCCPITSLPATSNELVKIYN